MLESAVATYFPASKAAFASATVLHTAISSFATPAYSKACTAFSTTISDTTAGLIPFINTI